MHARRTGARSRPAVPTRSRAERDDAARAPANRRARDRFGRRRHVRGDRGGGYALALEAGAELVDREFVQFFPIGHLAPRLVGMDPIMWNPFRYKLGGRLLNGRGEEFIQRCGARDEGRYVVTRDVATYAIVKEAAAALPVACGALP
jgi:succinate dehydrogenase/fumarate reductase flavoprotein subunit